MQTKGLLVFCSQSEVVTRGTAVLSTSAFIFRQWRLLHGSNSKKLFQGKQERFSTLSISMIFLCVSVPGAVSMTVVLVTSPSVPEIMEADGDMQEEEKFNTNRLSFHSRMFKIKVNSTLIHLQSYFKTCIFGCFKA